MLFETPTRSIGNMPDSHIFMTVGHVGNGPDIASAKDIQATFLIATTLAVDSRFPRTSLRSVRGTRGNDKSI